VIAATFRLGERSLARFRIIEGGCALQPDLAAESRDTERAIRLWHEKAADGCIPDLARFDFHQLRADWGYRFLISGDEFVGAAVFILYGLQFAKLLGLPVKPNSELPMIRQLPAHYRDLFVEGCDEVLIKSEPARFSGAVRHGGDVELYRVAFMPLRGKDALRPLIYGTFNRRAVPIPALRGTSTSERLQADRLYEEKPQRN
jgi:hypothetical protein